MVENCVNEQEIQNKDYFIGVFSNFCVEFASEAVNRTLTEINKELDVFIRGFEKCMEEGNLEEKRKNVDRIGCIKLAKDVVRSKVRKQNKKLDIENIFY